MERELEEERLKKEVEERRRNEHEKYRREVSQERDKVAPTTIIIGNDLSNPDPVSFIIL